jgi:hypothetical protein
MLEIFDRIRRLEKRLHSIPCFDISGAGADEIRTKFRDAGHYPDKIRLPYKTMLIGFEFEGGGEAACVADEINEQIIHLQWRMVTNESLTLWRSPYKVIIEYPELIISIREEDEEHGKELEVWSSVVIWTLAVLSARNVELIDFSPQMSRQVRRDKERKDQILKYKVLAIKPGKNGVAVPICNESLPAHFVRGSFGHYKIKGLFGKYRGSFWRPAHLRGNLDNGFTQKDYRF